MIMLNSHLFSKPQLMLHSLKFINPIKPTYQSPLNSLSVKLSNRFKAIEPIFQEKSFPPNSFWPNAEKTIECSLYILSILTLSLSHTLFVPRVFQKLNNPRQEF